MYSVALSALGYLVFVFLGGWREVSIAVAQVGTVGLAIALLLSLVNYALRFARWQLYLRMLAHRIEWFPSLRIYLAGFALTTTPGKAGEAFRGVLLKRYGVPYPDSFAAFFSERLSDLAAIVLLALLGLTLYPDARPLIYLGAALAGAGFLILSSRKILAGIEGMIAGRARGGKWLGHAFEVARQAQRCHRPTVLPAAMALSLTGWAAEALAFQLILHWMGIETTFAFAAFVFALSMLAGALSFTPGGLGSTEGVMAALLIWHGVSPADAIAATVLIRLTTLWFAVGLGTLIALLIGGNRP